MWHLCVAASIHGTPWMAPNSAHIDGPPQQLKFMEWVLAMHIWKPCETCVFICIHILQHDVHDVTCSRYLNHSGKKTNLCACQSKPVWNWNRAWRSSNFLFQVRGWPISSSRKRAMGFTRHRQKSSSDHRISPDGWISNGCNQPQTLHIIDDLTEHQQWGFNMI